MWKNGKIYPLDKNVNITATVGKSMEVSEKLRTEWPYDPEIQPMGIYPKDINMSYQRFLYFHVCSIIVHNSQNTESIKISSIPWKDKNVQTCIKADYSSIENSLLPPSFVFFWTFVHMTITCLQFFSNQPLTLDK